MNELLHTLSWPVLAVLHAAVTWYLCGLVWVVQVVHYPMFANVDAARFAEFERDHCARIGRIVMVPMLLEVAFATWIAAVAPASARPWPYVGLALLAVVWGSTFFVQVPCHDRLARGFDAATVRRLVTTNWLRTIAWTLRGGVAAWLVLQPA